MTAAAQVVEYLNYAMFVALAIVASVQWFRQRAEATKWFAWTFLTLSVGAVANLVTPDGDSTLLDLVLKSELAILILFPYFLYRFMGSFVRRAPWVKAMAVILTGGVIIWTYLLPNLSGEGDPPLSIQLWLLGFLLQWSVLSLLVTVRLWSAGRGQPSVARRRMRLLSVGALGMTAALIVAGSSSLQGQPTGIAFGVQIVVFLSVASFFLGFAPPAWLRTVWRRPESQALQMAVGDLMAARTTDDVAVHLLPQVVQITGARGAALMGADGEVIAMHGVDSGMFREVVDAAPDELSKELHTRRLLVLPFEFGSLVLWASVYTPFFGREEVDLVRSLGALTDIALERAALFARESEARGQLEAINQELSHREAQLAEAQKISRIGSWDWDFATDRTRWSNELFEIFGMEPGDTHLGFEGYMSAVHPEDRDFVESTIRQSIETREGFQYGHRIVRSDGSVRVLEARGRLMLDPDGEPLRMIGISQDVTDRKETEKALADAFSRERLSRIGLERANNELESFVNTVSHDLNSPLISLLGYLELLEKDFGAQIPSEARFYMERMEASATFMQSLIKDLLELSRAGRVQTEPEEVDLEQLITEIAGEIKATYPDIEIQTNTIPAISMNPVRARTLFANLMQNSVKHAGRPDVRIKVSAEPDPNALVSLSVADNGPGIPEQYRERVFGVFERLESSQEGTGIGLAVCKRIVETSGGQIWIEDSEEGTDMRLTVPAASNGASQ